MGKSKKTNNKVFKRITKLFHVETIIQAQKL